ncbi:hypothetical protein, partial [Escherichia albertii]|uniref:hypothetical protein n=2 Tax=Escherichia albertii TaxID=208962 RepID=UPI0030CA06A2
MEKRHRRGLFLILFFAHMLPLALSPDSVDHRITVFECADTARRSRTAERSESVSEEAEERLMYHFLLTHRYTVLHPVWCRIHRYAPVLFSASKRVCMLFWSSSAS